VNRELREAMLARAGHRCERCGVTDEELWREYGNDRLHVHHRDRDVQHNEPDNLEVLCASCHRKEHRNDTRQRVRWSREAMERNRALGRRLRALRIAAGVKQVRVASILRMSSGQLSTIETYCYHSLPEDFEARYLEALQIALEVA
jgi:hypothetical protein